MPVPKLTEAEIETALETLPGWSVAGGKLHKEYCFPNFIQAFGFMATAAIGIEKMDHHPRMVQRLQSRERGPNDA